MAAPPPAPGPPDQKPADRPDAGVDRSEPERYGPLTVARHDKDDGRGLILYTWRPGT